MSAFDGVPPTTAKVKELKQQLEDINVTMGQVIDNFANGTTAIKGFSAVMMTLVDVNKEIEAGMQAGHQSTPAYSANIANRLDALAQHIISVTGDPNNFFAAVIENEVPQLRAGTLSPAEAMQVIAGVLGPYTSGLFQEIADPHTSPTMRALDQDILRFLQSGQAPP